VLTETESGLVSCEILETMTSVLVTQEGYEDVDVGIDDMSTSKK